MKQTLKDFATAIVAGEKLTPAELVNLAISALTHASNQDHLPLNLELYRAARIQLYNAQDNHERQANAGA